MAADILIHIMEKHISIHQIVLPKLDQTLLIYDRNNIIVNAILLWQPDQNST